MIWKQWCSIAGMGSLQASSSADPYTGICTRRSDDEAATWESNSTDGYNRTQIDRAHIDIAYHPSISRSQTFFDHTSLKRSSRFQDRRALFYRIGDIVDELDYRIYNGDGSI